MSTDADVFPGVLRCAELGEYQDWLGVVGSVPKTIVNPLKRFCFAAPDEWCREQRAAGCCHLNDQQFRTVTLHHRVVSLHEEREEPQDMVTRPTRPAPVRLIDTPVPAPLDHPEQAPAIVWKPWTLGLESDPTITISATGQLELNAVADEQLGKPVAVQLLWNALPRMIGVRSVAITAPGAIKVTARDTNGRVRIRGAAAFLRYYNVDTTEQRRWLARMAEGAIAIELDAEPLPKWSNSGRKRKAA